MSQPFGQLIFGPPRNGDPPLASQVASGDEDGDLFFVCWDKEIMSHMEEQILVPKEQTQQTEAREDEDEVYHIRDTQPSGSGNWLEEAKSLMLDAEGLLLLRKLIGELHKASLQAAQDAFDSYDSADGAVQAIKLNHKTSYKTSLNVNLDDKRAVQLAKAYKLSLDLGKHGGLIKLPAHLHDRVPKDVRRFLC